MPVTLINVVLINSSRIHKAIVFSAYYSSGLIYFFAALKFITPSNWSVRCYKDVSSSNFLKVNPFTAELKLTFCSVEYEYN